MREQVEVEKLGDILVPEALGNDRFRMTNTRGGWARLFGGQIVAQALAAGGATVEDDRLVNSLHAYFLRAGERGTALECAVERERDGRSFSNRRVVASQNGKPSMLMAASPQKAPSIISSPWAKLTVSVAL